MLSARGPCTSRRRTCSRCRPAGRRARQPVARHEYRPHEFRALCRATSAARAVRPLPRPQARAHVLASASAGTRGVTLCVMTKPFYDGLTPAIYAATSCCAGGGLDGALASSRTCGRERPRLASSCTATCRYLEGFGTWPFGEEWLLEAIATCYLPLLDVLAPRQAGDALAGAGPVRPARAPGWGSLPRLPARGRRETHRRASPGLRPACARAGGFRGAYTRPPSYDRAPAPPGRARAATSWTSSATHAVLPLLATHAGVRVELGVGIEAHRATVPLLEAVGLLASGVRPLAALGPLLEEAGAHATCVDLTDVLGRSATAHLRPLRCAPGPDSCRSTASMTSSG